MVVRPDFLSVEGGGGGASRIFQGVLLLSAVITFLFCFLPEISHDSLVYHINLPKIYAQTGAIRVQEYDLMTYRPMLFESLYSLAFIFKSVPFAKLVHWLSGFLLTVGVVRLVEAETKSYRLAIFLGAVLFTSPLFINEVQTTYTDIGSAFFAFLSFVLLLEGMSKAKYVYYGFAGVFMGLAISTKLLTSLMACGVVLAFWACAAKNPRERRPDVLKHYLVPMIVFGAGIFLGFGYWIVRNAVLTGNPLYPYFASLFGSQGAAIEQEFIQGGVQKNLLSFLGLPFLMEFVPEAFDRHHYIGPFFLLALPLMICEAFWSMPALFAAITFGAVLFIWYFLCQNYRYLLPVMPLLFFAAAIGFVSLDAEGGSKRWLRRFAVVAGILCLCGNIVLGVYHFRGHFKAVLGGWSSERYLVAMESSMDAALWVNRNLPADAKILSVGAIRAFYFDRAYVAGDMYTLRHPEISRMNSADVLKQIKQRGFTHLLVRQPENPVIAQALAQAPTYAPLFRLSDLKNGLQEVYHLKSRNTREENDVFAIYKIT